MTAVVHGGIDYAELAALGIEPGMVLDFSSNVNPFGPPPAVREALATLNPVPYPDRACRRLRALLADRHGCTAESVLVGNGSAELIHLVGHALLQAGDWTLVVEPTFGEYAHASRLGGATVVGIRAYAGDDFALDTAALLAAITIHRPRLVWLCVPNNPTGVTVGGVELLAVVEACAEIDAWLVLDRAYADLERGAVRSTDTYWPTDHVLELYSLTKAYALAGLRIGYLVGSPPLLAHIAAYQPAWSVNSAAQAAGETVLRDRSYLADTLGQWWASSDALRAGLEALDLPVLPSSLPFFLVHVSDGTRVRAALLHGGCLVRDCASFGLPAYVRVAPRAPEHNQVLIDVWRKRCLRP